MGADADAKFLGELHGLPHDHRIRGMEAASDIGSIDERHQRSIVADAVEAEAFAHVTVHFDKVHRHFRCTTALCVRAPMFSGFRAGKSLRAA